MKKIYTVISCCLMFSLNVAANGTAFDFPFCNNELSTTDNFAPPVLTRGPYLQSGKQDSITIRWRTDIPCDTKITWGTVFGTYPNLLTDATSTTEHILRIGGLSADTKYWYTIGSTATQLQATNTNYFLTLPPSNTTRKLRFLAIGDCGNASTNQIDVKNTFLNFIGSNDVDAMITLGDNAYSSGLDAEFQTEFFDIYKNDLLRNYKLYTAPGNHDYGNSLANTGKTGATPALSMPYHLNFTVPSNGELGGLPSNVKNYYSFNVGEVHFISLDSYGKDDANTTNLYDTTGAQATWLKADLAANTKKWTVAYFHHPPYTKTSHTSDTEMDLVAVREKFVRILERYGVDLVLCGHAHGYERSYLMKGFYNTYASPLLDANFAAASHTATGNTQNAKYNGIANSCPYTYNSGQYNHGTVYVVAGSAGQIGGTSGGYPQNCMYYSDATNGGCFYFEVDSNRLDAKFISYATAPTPVIRDQFTIFKDINKTNNITTNQNQSITLTASWRGTYYWPNNAGATTQSVTITNPAVGSFAYTVRDANAGSCIQDAFNVTVNAALPISLVSFRAALNYDRVLLDWTTAQEQNNKYFTIERSVDGTNFSVLGTINGSGTTTDSRDYRFIDFTPAEGINYYRLSQTDIDGRINYYGTRIINYKNSRNFSAGIVNLSNGNIKMIINSSKNDNVNLKLVDISGKEVIHESFAVATGSTAKSFLLQNGVYVAVLSNSVGERAINKIVVQ